jgi:enolase
MIKGLELAEVYNAVKEKTVKASIKTENGIFSGCSPSGSSAGMYEAKKLSMNAVKRVFPSVKRQLLGKDESEVDGILEKMGINNIGANLSIGLSIAAVRSMTDNQAYKFFSKNARKFPLPLGNVIGGGAHRGFTSEQEFLVIPMKARSMKEAVRTNHDIWQEVGVMTKKIRRGNNYEGAWICDMSDIDTLNLLSAIAEDYGARVGVDFASSEMFSKGQYNYKDPIRVLSPGEQMDFVLYLIKTYNLAYVEDPFHENDFEHFAELTKKVKDCLVVGDDLFVTNTERLKKGIRKKAGNATIIKPDQIGLVSKTLEAVKLAQRSGFRTVVSHRSRDTTDSFIADLAVGTSSPLLKCGIHGKERSAKLNRLVTLWKYADKPSITKLF